MDIRKQHRETAADPRPAPDSRSALPLSHARCAFARVEAISLVLIAFVLITILLATTSESRRLAMLNRDLANLRQIGAWTFAYANDYEDLHPSFSSAPNTRYDDLLPLASSNQIRQAVGQAIDIVRRRSGRDHFPVPIAWFPHVYYTHLVLADYVDRALPDTAFVSTGDEHRLNWLDDPINKHDEGFWQPFQNPPSGTVSPSQWRWPFSASYQFDPATYDRNQSRWDVPWARISPGAHGSYSVPNIPLGGVKFSDVSYPAQKVLAHDYGAWHFSKQPQFFAHESARVVVLMDDGAASARTTANSNGGWRPTSPSRPNTVLFAYSARRWEPPNTEPGIVDRLVGHYRWTRGGIKGRDFDGPEINTGQK